MNIEAKRQTTNGWRTIIPAIQGLVKKSAVKNHKQPQRPALKKRPTQNPIFNLFAMAMVLFSQAGPVQSVNASPLPPTQVFYLSMPEDQTLVAFKKIYASATAPVHSVTGLSIIANNTVVYYDQWENGFDTDLSNPTNVWSSSNLGGTQFWGDGLAANGCAPNVDGKTALSCTNANDVLNAGNVIVLENDIPLPRNNANIFWDGRDKVGVTKTLAVTRSVWASKPGTVLTDAIEVYDTSRWGTNYSIPIGENSSASLMFTYVSLIAIASQNNTTVNIDKNGDGVVDLTKVLNEGEPFQVDGGVNASGTVNSDKPVQVDLITGKAGSVYSNRWFHVPPSTQWQTSFWTPVGTTSASYPANVFLFNPSASAITVNYETKAGTGTLPVPAKSNARFVMPLASGAHFFTSDGSTFIAIGTIDSSVSGTNSTYDWGYTLVPDEWLTSAFVAGWAPGTGDAIPKANGSPIWVTALKDTTIYVDNGDPAPAASNTAPNGKKYDVSYPISRLESKQIFGANFTQTGMKVFTADGTSITGAWGEDPSKAAAGTPYLDAGYTIPPLPEIVLSKEASLAIDVNSNGKIDPGDTMLYTVTVRNNGAVTAFNSVVSEPGIAANTTYVANSTKVAGVAVSDNAAPYPFPLDSSGGGTGITIPQISVGGSVEIVYKLKADNTPPVYTTISNTINTTSNGEEYSLTIDTPINNTQTPASSCTVAFSTAAGANASSYLPGGSLYVRIVDADTAGQGPLVVDVLNAAKDREALSLDEGSTGIFQNAAAVALSESDGLSPDDGILNVSSGDSLTVSYTDPINGDTCSDTISISVESKIKQLYLNDANKYLTRVDPVGKPLSTTYSSDILSAMSSSDTISHGAATSASTSSAGTTLTYSYTPTSGSNRLLLVSVATGSSDNNNSTQGKVTGITFNNVGMHFAKKTEQGTGTNTNSYIYYLLESEINTSSAANVVVTVDNSSTMVSFATMYSNIDQTNPIAQSFTNSNESGSNSVLFGNTYSVPAGNVMFSIGSIEEGSTSNHRNITLPATNAPTEIAKINSHSYVDAAISDWAGARSLTTSTKFYDIDSSRNWTLTALSLSPSGGSGSGGLTDVTFTQTPGMAGTFDIVAGQITVVAYITLTTGVLADSAHPAVTATVKADGTTLATLTNPTYNSTDKTLTWTGAVSSQSVAATKAVTLKVATTDTNIAFKVDYGSSSAASRVDLPTSSVINVSTLGIFSAAYPAVTTMPNPISGQTLYLRAEVTDPFGFADITGATLQIKAATAGGYDQTFTLTDANVVNTAGVKKIYEYAWASPAAADDYTFTFTGLEGYELTPITHSKAINTKIAFQDTGSPSTVEFTNGTNGTSANSYDSTLDSTNQVCLRVTDLDQNANPAAEETVTVTVSSTRGDPETITLNETGINTGIFVKCMDRQNGPSSGDGKIYAEPGDLLTVNYTDPNDPGDTSSDTAVLTTTVLVINVGKTLVSPASGKALLGDPIVFDITVANPNPGEMNTVHVIDTFDTACLAFKSASIAPTSQTGNQIDWSDIGPIPGLGTKTLTVTFDTTATPCLNTQNNVTAMGVDTNSSQGIGPVASAAPVTTVRTGVTVTKQLTSSSPADVGSDVTYKIDITNTGSSTIQTLPLSDTYSAYCMQFKESTPATAGSGGLVFWENLGPLYSGSTTSVYTTFTVKGPCNPSTNTATVDSAVDENGFSVPTDTDENIELITAGNADLSITKTDGSGLFAAGSAISYTITASNAGPDDVSGVVITDTMPANLTNVSWVCTPTSGAYCTPSGVDGINDTNVTLPNGGSVVYMVSATVVDAPTTSLANTASITAPAGIIDADPTNNSATDTNELVGKISGKVWNDLNNNATAEPGETAISTVTIQLFTDPNGDGDPADGVQVGSSVTTNAQGEYEFTNLAPGKYVVVETNPTGFTSSGDSQGSATDERVALTVAAGDDLTSNDFFDWQPSSISGTVFNDLNGDGTFDTGEPGLDGVTVTLKNSGGTVLDTATTDTNGDYSFTDLEAGSYIVEETDTTGFTSTEDADGGVNKNSIAITLTANQDDENNDFFDWQPSSISGHVYNDLDGNGVFDTGEPGLSGVTITLKDSEGNIITTATTDSDGVYTFPDLPAGDYTLEETDPTGATSSGDSDGDNDNTIAVTLTANQSSSGNKFFDWEPSSISGTVIEDLNGDGNKDTGETGRSGVTINLLDSEGTIIDTTTSAADGKYTFGGLPAGSYTVQEVDPTGTTSTGDSDGDDKNNTSVILTAGQDTTGIDFFDWSPAVLTGHLFIDTNGDGIQDPGEPDLSGIKVKITDSLGVDHEVTTDAFGDWTITVPTGTTTIDIDETSAGYPTGASHTQGEDPTEIEAVAGDNDGGTDGLHDPSIDLSLLKEADDDTPNVGTTLTFTLTLQNDNDFGNAANTISVADVLPDGYTYVAGSVNYNTGTSGATIVADESAAPALTWAINFLPDGEIVTLTYQALVNASGSYENLAEVIAADETDVDSTPANHATAPSEDDTSSTSPVPVPVADLSISKTNAVSEMDPGQGYTYTIRVSNEGPSPVTGAILKDAAATGLKKSNVACSEAASNSCALASTPTIADLESLAGYTLPEIASGDFYEIEVESVVDVDASGTITNEASVTLPDGTTDPDAANNTATDEDTLLEAGMVGIAKELFGTPEKVASGTFRTTFILTVKNYGLTILTDLQVSDDLSDVFTDPTVQPVPTSFTVHNVTSDDFTVNWPVVSGVGFNGDSDTNLLTGTDTLDVGESGTITLVVDVVPALNNPFSNVAAASANGGEVIDTSTNGYDPDPDDDLDPTNNQESTEITFTGDIYDPPTGVKTFDQQGNAILQWEAVWVNDNNLVALDARSTDPIPEGATFYDDGVPSGFPLPGGLPALSTTSGVSCFDNSALSSTTACYYEGPSPSYLRGRIVWEGTIGPDFGVSFNNNQHGVHVRYNLLPDPGSKGIKNIATISIDANGNGNYTDAGEFSLASATTTWQRDAKELPKTGFAPNIITPLLPSPAKRAYQASGMTIEIPSLKVNLPIVGVPLVDGSWDVSWLFNQAGYLNGTAFPTLDGNSVITAHVYNADGKPGPFVGLPTLKWGDQVILHAYGSKYIYEVREMQEILPSNQSPLEHKEGSWVTLLTCKQYDLATNSYLKRQMARAVLVKVIAE